MWGGGGAADALRRKDIREFLDWVYERAVKDQGTNPGRTASKAREHLRAILYWAWEQESIDSPPRFPGPRDQREVAGRHYLTKPEINAFYFSTHMMTSLLPHFRHSFPRGAWQRVMRGSSRWWPS